MDKAILDEFGQAVHDLRTHATEASEAVKALGGKFTVYDEKASKISDRLDKLEGTVATNAYTDQIADIRKNFADSLEELEAKISRIHGGGGRNVAQKSVHQAAFTKMVRKGVSHEAMHHASFLNADEVKALTVGNDVGGGYLAPPEFVQQLIDENIVEISPLRGLINVRPTVRGSIMMPTITGHASAKWVDETGDRAETQNPKFGSKEIRTNEQYAMVKVSRMDLEDSVFDVEAMLRQEFGMQFGVAENEAFLTGDGVGKPQGIIPNLLTANIINSGSGSDITADSIVSVPFELKEFYLSNAVYVMHRTTLRQVRLLKDGYGAYIWQPGLTLGSPGSINGFGYRTVIHMPTIAANAKAILFGDFRRMYTAVDRISMEIMTDPISSKQTGMVEFSARRRVGGGVIVAEAMAAIQIAL